MKFMITELSEKSGLHRNTIYSLIHRGIITPVEVISNIMIFNDETVKAIKRHYEDKLNSKLCKMVDSTANS